MTKLHQTLAIEKGARSRSERALANADRLMSKSALLNGHLRVYRPVNSEDTEIMPQDETRVQVRVQDTLQDAAEHLARLWDIVATKEQSNTKASADLVLNDGTILLEKVPVTTLLFLDKQLINLHTLISRLPILDAQYEWTFDGNTNLFRTPEQQTHRTKKIEEPLVLYPATDKHPAQTQLVSKDTLVGFWHATHFSGAITAQKRQDMIDKVEELQTAVKKAREAANDRDIEDTKIAEKILGFVLPDISLRGEMSTATAGASE